MTVLPCCLRKATTLPGVVAWAGTKVALCSTHCACFHNFPKTLARWQRQGLQDPAVHQNFCLAVWTAVGGRVIYAPLTETLCIPFTRMNGIDSTADIQIRKRAWVEGMHERAGGNGGKKPKRRRRQGNKADQSGNGGNGRAIDSTAE
jgi:hypothetical protein